MHFHGKINIYPLIDIAEISLNMFEYFWLFVYLFALWSLHIFGYLWILCNFYNTVFCSSPAEKAYEVGASNGVDAGLEGGQDQLGLVGKDNSIFVAALKEHLQAERGSLKDTVQSLLNATAKSMGNH